MRIVLDTNVLVAGLLSPYGPPAQVLRLVLSGNAQLCFDMRILTEYRQVLARPKFGFEKQSVTDLGDFLEETGDSTSPTPCGLDLPDLDDAMFLEVARASGAAYLVTGDLKHFPERMRTGILVVTPSVFIAEPACR